MQVDGSVHRGVGQARSLPYPPDVAMIEQRIEQQFSGPETIRLARVWL